MRRLFRRSASVFAFLATHPGARDRVLGFDRYQDDSFVEDLARLGGLARHVAEILATVSAAPMGLGDATTERQRLLHEELSPLDETTFVDARLASMLMKGAGIVAPDEARLAINLLGCLVRDISAVPGDARAGPHFQVSLILTSDRECTLSTNTPCGACDGPRLILGSPAYESLALVVLSLLNHHGIVLRRLGPWAVGGWGMDTYLCGFGGLRRLPSSATRTMRLLLDQPACEASELALTDHLHHLSDGAKSCSAFAAAAQRAVQPRRSALSQLLNESRAWPNSDIVTGSVQEISEPLASALVIAQVVFLARIIRGYS